LIIVKSLTLKMKLRSHFGQNVERIEYSKMMKLKSGKYAVQRLLTPSQSTTGREHSQRQVVQTNYGPREATERFAIRGIWYM
jgi:hypothetical protein